MPQVVHRIGLWKIDDDTCFCELSILISQQANRDLHFNVVFMQMLRQEFLNVHTEAEMLNVAKTRCKQISSKVGTRAVVRSQL
jgi:hypothetical protein